MRQTARQQRGQAVAGMIAGAAVVFMGVALATSDIVLGPISIGQSVMFGIIVIVAGSLYAIAQVIAITRLRHRGAAPPR